MSLLPPPPESFSQVPRARHEVAALRPGGEAGVPSPPEPPSPVSTWIRNVPAAGAPGSEGTAFLVASQGFTLDAGRFCLASIMFDEHQACA